MKCVFALLPDDEVHNVVRKKAVEIDRMIGNGLVAAYLPPHISLKSGFDVDAAGLNGVEEYFDTFAAGLNPFEMTFEKYVRWQDVIMAHVSGQEKVRKLHTRLNDDLQRLFGIPEAGHDGSGFHFHLTVAAFGTADEERYEQAFDALCTEPLGIRTRIDRIGLLYYQGDDTGIGRHVTYKINKLVDYRRSSQGGTVKKDDFAYCGLNCVTCKERFAVVRRRIKELDEAFDVVNVTDMVKAIPFMSSKYRGYRKLADFFNHECPGCREGGGNPFCGIRKCAKKKGFDTCVECGTDMCGKFKSLLKIHKDNEIQDNRDVIRPLE